MFEMYIYKTIISFISINAVLFMFKTKWMELPHENNGFIKVMFMRLAPCLIPVFRWIWIVIIIILSFALFNPSVMERCKEDKHE